MFAAGVTRMAPEDEVGPQVASLVRALDDADGTVRNAASTALGWLGHEGRLVDRMNLVSANADVRAASIYGLGDLTKAGALTGEKLRGLIARCEKDPDEGVKDAVTYSLAIASKH
jgi:hypothetical protein